MNTINKINESFKKHTTYKFVNTFSKTKMRNMSNGITINDAILYKILYTDPKITHSTACDKIGHVNNTFFTRQSYDSKEDNISVEVYKSILEDIKNIYYKQITGKKRKIIPKIIAIDGVKNNDNKHNVNSNMGYYDVTNQIPIFIENHGTENTDIEVATSKAFILKI